MGVNIGRKYNKYFRSSGENVVHVSNNRATVYPLSEILAVYMLRSCRDPFLFWAEIFLKTTEHILCVQENTIQPH